MMFGQPATSRVQKGIREVRKCERMAAENMPSFSGSEGPCKAGVES
jgi:hypothetical protein